MSNSSGYSQSKALWAITRASFKAIFHQPSSIFFSLLFPIAFILLFALLGDRPAAPTQIAFEKNTDTHNPLYDSIAHNPTIKTLSYTDTATMYADLRKGKLGAVVSIIRLSDTLGQYQVKLLSSDASENAVYQLQKSIDYQALKIELNDLKQLDREYVISTQVISGKKYRSIDFILPGMIGFSVLFSTLFGIAFLFFNLREQLVLKRFYASPVKKINILVGIGVSRLFYQLINIIVLILFGHFLLHFTLVHGIITFFEMLVLSLFMLFILMGASLIISSLAKNDTFIPLMINVFAFPQILFSGTFFSIDVFPRWMQIICSLLPLTPFNTAMRKISFEGLHLYNCWQELAMLGVWAIVIYAIAIKVMKWE